MKLLLLGRGVEDDIEYLAEAAHKMHCDAVPQIIRQRLVIPFVGKGQDDLGNPRAPRDPDGQRNLTTCRVCRARLFRFEGRYLSFGSLFATRNVHF